MINWKFLELKNLLTIGAIVLLVRIVFTKAINSLDGTSADNSSN